MWQPLYILSLLASLASLAVLKGLARSRKKVKPLVSVAGFIFLYVLGLLIQPLIPAVTWNVIGRYYTTMLLVILAFSLIRLGVWLIFDVFIARRRRAETADILKQLAIAILFTLSIFMIIRHTLNINLASLLTTSAILSIIIGLALQDTLANMFAGLSIQLEKPFSIGDWIAFENYTGRVEAINWRTTTIKPLSLDHVIIPNMVIAKNPLTNFNRPTSLHVRNLSVGAHLHVPPNRAKEAILMALREDPDISWENEPQIRVKEYGDSFISYDIRFCIKDFSRHLLIEDRVMTRVWYYLRRADITIPYPVRDVRLQTVTPGMKTGDLQAERCAIAETIGNVDFLSPLSDDESEALAEQVNLYTAFKDEIIIRQGDPGDSCFIIQKGLAEVLLDMPSGESIVGTLGKGQVFGEMSLMTGDRRTATVRAATDMEVILVDKESFSHILAANPDITAKISEILARRHLELEQKTKEQAEPIQQESIDSRTSQMIASIRHFFRL